MLKPKILFNCSTNNFGGGVKNSSLFIIETLHNETINWTYAISIEVAEFLKNKGISFDHRFSIFSKSPAMSFKARKALINLVKDTKPNLVYTMAGPAYVKFPVYHILGLSNAFITHANWSDFQLKGNLIKRASYLVHVGLQLLYSRRANHYVFQTEEARIKYCKRAYRNKINTSVISNAFDVEMFSRFSEPEKRMKKNKFQIFCPGGGYSHKAFQFIPPIAKELSKLTDIPFEFVLTIPETTLFKEIERKAIQLGVRNYISNVGPYNYTEAANLYKQADIVFVPSLLETFSASYLEAMAAKKILVVSDKDFAREVCEGAATYVDPLNPTDTAYTLAVALNNPDKFYHTIKKGEFILKKYGNQQERFQKIIDLLLGKYQMNFLLS